MVKVVAASLVAVVVGVGGAYGYDHMQPDERGRPSKPAREQRATPADETAATTRAPKVVDPPRAVVLRSTRSGGVPASVVDSIGAFPLSSSASLPRATARFGEPSNSGPSDADPNVCAAAWDGIGLEARFFFGQPPSPERSCTEGPLATAVMRGEGWQLSPADLAVGDAEDEVTRAFPAAVIEPLDPALVSLSGSTDAYVLSVGASGGRTFSNLYATVNDGLVESFIFVSGAD